MHPGLFLKCQCDAGLAAAHCCRGSHARRSSCGAGVFTSARRCAGLRKVSRTEVLGCKVNREVWRAIATGTERTWAGEPEPRERGGAPVLRGRLAADTDAHPCTCCTHRALHASRALSACTARRLAAHRPSLLLGNPRGLHVAEQPLVVLRSASRCGCRPLLQARTVRPEEVLLHGVHLKRGTGGLLQTSAQRHRQTERERERGRERERALKGCRQTWEICRQPRATEHPPASHSHA